MKTASAVLQHSSLFVTLTFQIEEQKKKKQEEQQQQFSQRKQTNHNHFLRQLFLKTIFLAAGLLVGEFNGFDSVHSSFQNVSCQLRGIPISPRTS